MNVLCWFVTGGLLSNRFFTPSVSFRFLKPVYEPCRSHSDSEPTLRRLPSRSVCWSMYDVWYVLAIVADHGPRSHVADTYCFQRGVMPVTTCWYAVPIWLTNEPSFCWLSYFV